MSNKDQDQDELEGCELSARQERFCREYIVDFNGSQAATRAGYSADPSTARSTASRLLTYHNIQARLATLKAEQNKRLDFSADRVLLELARIAFADQSQCFDEEGNLLKFKQMPEDIRRALAGMEVFEEFEGAGRERVHVGNTKKVKSWDKVKALELLGKHHKLFTDKVEHGGKLTLEDLVVGSLGKES